MLCIMATFYGVFAEKVRRERHSKVELIDYVAALKQAEKERESLIRQLQDALTKVKVLQGILPICARCKKIRDGKGNWHPMESYIREHSDADFTHGVCPECLNKLYPGYSERSEEHTSELQSRPHLVCRLLLEKKKKKRCGTQYTIKATEDTTRRSMIDFVLDSLRC